MNRALMIAALCLLAGVADATRNPSSGTLSPLPVTPNATLHDQLFIWPQGQAQSGGTVASYSVQMAAGVSYTFTASGPTPGTTTDVVLVLTGAGNSVIAQNDGQGRTATISFTPNAAGSYTVKLRSGTPGAWGHCTFAATSSQFRVQASGQLLFPDLIQWPHPGVSQYDAYIRLSNGRKQLTWSNATPNIGDGPLNLYAVQQPDGTWFAYEHVLDNAGGSTDFHIATYNYPPTWTTLHTMDLWNYNLRAVASGGGLGPVVASQQKYASGIEDDVQYVPTPPNAGPGEHNSSYPYQGIDVGWADVYVPSDQFQYIDVTNVPDGVYWLEAVVNPNDVVLEKNYNNDTSWLKLQIQGTGVTPLPGSPTVGAGPVSAVRAYPNPFEPARGDVGMIFAGLSTDGRVRIYSLTGQLVRDMSANGTATLVWDGRNDHGADVASGVYFALVDSNGDHTTLKVAIQR